MPCSQNRALQLSTYFHFVPTHFVSARPLQFAAMNDVQRAELRRYVGMAKSGGMAKATAGCLDYLETEGLAFQLNIKCVHIGVHRSNRGGMGVDLHHMHELMRTICLMGYVEQGIGARVFVRKYTYPSSAVEQALAQLADLYMSKKDTIFTAVGKHYEKVRAPSFFTFEVFLELSPPQRAPTTAICVCACVNACL